MVGDDVYKSTVMKRNWVFTNLSHKVLYIVMWNQCCLLPPSSRKTHPKMGHKLNYAFIRKHVFLYPSCQRT